MKNSRIFDFNNGIRYDLIQNQDTDVVTKNELMPYDYQQEILDKLQAERAIQHSNKNLIVSATGTGKTIVSAFDYKRFKENNPNNCRLLFIAHRKEILEQSISAFRRVLADSKFGELAVGEYKPKSLDYLFCSIQTFNSQELTKRLPANYYDFIIVDEFHHACADSYQELLKYFKPQILLGLTGTPERMDGQDILQYFNGRIASEIRLPDAINQGLLVPFTYYMVADTVDLRNVTWEKGAYKTSELTKLFAIDKLIAEKRASNIIGSLDRYIPDFNSIKGLGFCVSVEHAKFMADYFNNHGIASISLDANTNKEDRAAAKEKLINGQIKYIFVVDLYNEGVDIPEINTILFLRPTESLTVYLQQLGRGLRLSNNKERLTVLDFVAQANKNFDYESRFRALQLRKRNKISEEIKMGFVSMPKGCYIKLEQKAMEAILANLKKYFNTRNDLVDAIKAFVRETALPLTLGNFLEYYNLTPKDIYSKKQIFARLCVEAKQKSDFNDEFEKTSLNGLLKLSLANSRRFINFLMRALTYVGTWSWDKFNDLERKMVNMFTITIYPYDQYNPWTPDKGLEFANRLYSRKEIKEEILEILKYQNNHIDFVDEELDIDYETPLDVYCNYTRDQLLVAFDYFNVSSARQGVAWIEKAKTDVFLITLEKPDEQFTATTQYEDYAIDNETFHWQSQSVTAATSPTCKRYINHKSMGTNVVLFVREKQYLDDLSIRAPFTFIGSAEYISHTGSKPVSIIWHLNKPLPAKFLRMTKQIIASAAA